MENKKFEYSRLTDLIIKQAEELNRAYKELQNKNKELSSLYYKGIEIVATVIELNDPYTAGHMSRVSLISLMIADELEFINISDKLYVAAILHDIGKVGVPTTLLTRPKELNSQEYELIKTHTKLSYDILKNLNLEIAEIVYQHHEKCDGSGYPRGLKEAEISDTANIITFADILEAMASHRPYRPAFSKDEVISYLNENKCWFKEQIFEVGMGIFINNGFDDILKNASVKNILSGT